MINAVKYRDEITNSCDCKFGFSNRVVKCEYEECASCVFSNVNNDDGRLSCTARKIRWLLSECKDPAKLTRLEYEILKWLIDKGYKYIARESNCKLIVCYKKPSKGRYCWEEINGLCLLSGFEELLQFIKWSDEEPIFMQDILDSCEVIENDI